MTLYIAGWQVPEFFAFVGGLESRRISRYADVIRQRVNYIQISNQ